VNGWRFAWHFSWASAVVLSVTVMVLAAGAGIGPARLAIQTGGRPEETRE